LSFKFRFDTIESATSSILCSLSLSDSQGWSLPVSSESFEGGGVFKAIQIRAITLQNHSNPYYGTSISF
jgi:hypothetical protein